jgi:hypothetical protein
VTVRPAIGRNSGKMKLVDMEVQHVEIAGALAHAIEHQHVVRSSIADACVEAQCLGNAGHQIGRRNRIPACEQRHVMAKRHQLFGEVGNYP